MPCSDKRLTRYLQVYSRIGLARHYQPPTGDGLTFVLIRQWRKLRLDLDSVDFTDAQAIAASPAVTSASCNGCSPRSDGS